MPTDEPIATTAPQPMADDKASHDRLYDLVVNSGAQIQRLAQTAVLQMTRYGKGSPEHQQAMRDAYNYMAAHHVAFNLFSKALNKGAARLGLPTAE